MLPSDRIPSPTDIPRHIWSEAAIAILAMEERRASLMRMAETHRAAGALLRDQDIGEEIHVLKPARPSLRPLVLIGGMGPMAGLDGFITACRFCQLSGQVAQRTGL
jgi:hypothetical protein